MGNKYNNSVRRRGTVVEVKYDDFNRALRTWSKKVQDSGMLQEVKERMGYEKPAVEKQRRKKESRRRWERKVEGMITDGLWHKEKNY